MKKLVLAGVFALTVLVLGSSQASATYPCWDVHRPCWEIPLPRFPLVIPNIKFYCADCCPSHNCFKQPWYQYFPPQANYGYASPWMNYAAPHAYPYAGAPANYGNRAGAPAQGYTAPQQAAAPNYNAQGLYAGQDFGGQGSFAPPAYWYGRELQPEPQALGCGELRRLKPAATKRHHPSTVRWKNSPGPRELRAGLCGFSWCASAPDEQLGVAEAALSPTYCGLRYSSGQLQPVIITACPPDGCRWTAGAMSESTAETASPLPELVRPSSRWQWLYFALAAFDVFAISGSLFLNHQIMGIYRGSVTVNEAWAERLRDASELGRLATTVNAPGNDVFATQDIDGEKQRMQEAQRTFQDHLRRMRIEWRNAGAAPETQGFLGDLGLIEHTMMEMSAEGASIFAAFQARQPAEAGRHMAAMDRKLVTLNGALARLQTKIAVVQQDQFDAQTRAATVLQRFEYAVAVLILLMVGGAAFYGYQLARQVRAAERESQRLQEALETRVAERTAALSKSNEALSSSERSRARLLGEVMSAQEDERRRIARDLHDEIGQSLTSVLLGLRTVEQASEIEAARARASELRRTAATALDEVRRLARGLRPAVLDDLGLAAALERLASDFHQAHGLVVQLDWPAAGDGRLPAPVETALYRIIQEALTNVARHARASKVEVSVAQFPGRVRVDVADDGRGFDARAQGDRAGSGSTIGLSSMQERAKLLNGTARIDSRPGGGTRVIAEIPLTEENHVEDSRVPRG